MVVVCPDIVLKYKESHFMLKDKRINITFISVNDEATVNKLSI